MSATKRIPIILAAILVFLVSTSCVVATITFGDQPTQTAYVVVESPTAVPATQTPYIIVEPPTAIPYTLCSQTSPEVFSGWGAPQYSNNGRTQTSYGKYVTYDIYNQGYVCSSRPVYKTENIGQYCWNGTIGWYFPSDVPGAQSPDACRRFTPPQYPHPYQPPFGPPAPKPMPPYQPPLAPKTFCPNVPGGPFTYVPMGYKVNPDGTCVLFSPMPDPFPHHHAP